MKTSFIQIFDDKQSASEALGFIGTAFPKHRHELVESNQLQVWANIGGAHDAKAYGAPDATIIYCVLSVAP